MPKLSDEKIKQIVKVLDNSDFAINTLERANGNKMLFNATKTSIQQLSQELKDRYILSEIKDE